METLSKTPAVDGVLEKVLCPTTSSLAVSESLSSYREYPAHSPYINTLMHHSLQRRKTCAPRQMSPSKAFPETSSAAILSALKNLQEKIRRLEAEKGRAELTLHTVCRGGLAAHMQPESVKSSQTLSDSQTNEHPNCNQALISQLAAAESRCGQLERQLELTRRMVRHAKADKTSLKIEQVSVETSRSAGHAPDSVSVRAQLEKLERLEQEYLRLIRTQDNAERKICELEMRLQEEEQQRKLVQDKANLLQTGLEANRILLRSVSPQPPNRKRSKEKRVSSQLTSQTQPHYRLSLGDVPFVAGTAVGGSHSVRANVQSVLSLLKQHQPQLCNSRVLSHTPLVQSRSQRANQSNSDSGSSSSSTCGEELADLLQALQDELRLMSLEHDALMRQVEANVSAHERKELQRDQEKLLLRMERKGEQISKLYKHKSQMKKLQMEVCNKRRGSMGKVKVTTTVTTRGRSAGPVKLGPGERSRRSLKLLRDMKALQTSLQT